MTDNDTLQRAIVRSDASIRTVMARLDRNRIKLGLVLDEGGRLLRTVTDGDIRRALLGGALLDDAISACLPSGPLRCRRRPRLLSCFRKWTGMASMHLL